MLKCECNGCGSDYDMHRGLCPRPARYRIADGDDTVSICTRCLAPTDTIVAQRKPSWRLNNALWRMTR